MALDATLPHERAPQGPSASDGSLPELVIEPPSGLAAVDWRDVWRYRELLYFLTWRDVKVRYKQTLLGVAWTVLQPFLTMVVFSIFLGRLAGLDEKTGGVPYPAFLICGLLPWTFFAKAVGASSESVVGSSNLITKVYFPRLIIPLASIGAALVDLAVSSVVLVGLLLYYRLGLSVQILVLPLLVLGTLLAAAGVGTLFSALTVAYRDFRYITTYAVQLWMFATPIIYPTSVVPEQWRPLFSLNPLVGLIEGFRACFLGQPLDWPQLALSLGVSAAVFAIGATYFRSVERRFADVI